MTGDISAFETYRSLKRGLGYFLGKGEKGEGNRRKWAREERVGKRGKGRGGRREERGMGNLNPYAVMLSLALVLGCP